MIPDKSLVRDALRRHAKRSTALVFNRTTGVTLKKILVLLVLSGAGYQGWIKLSPAFTKTDPLYDSPYVVVYGRNTCGHTQKTIKELKKAGIPFEYQIVDDKSVADLLHARMQDSGIDTRRYNLPVVDVSNDISIRPATAVILDAYDNSPI